MRTIEDVLQKYESAGSEEKLNLFLEYPELRADFSDIDHNDNNNEKNKMNKKN